MKCGGLAKIGKTEYYKMLKNAGIKHTKVLPLLLCKRAVTTRWMGVCSQSAGAAESPGIWSIVLHGKWCQTTFVPRISKSVVSLNKSWQWLFCSNQNSRFWNLATMEMTVPKPTPWSQNLAKSNRPRIWCTIALTSSIVVLCCIQMQHCYTTSLILGWYSVQFLCGVRTTGTPLPGGENNTGTI